MFSCTLYAAEPPLILETLEVKDSTLSAYSSPSSYSATRTESSSLTVPFSVGVVNQALLQDSMALRLEESAMFVSGVQQSSADSGFNTDLRIRGFTTAGSAYLDGVLDNQKFQVRDMALVDKVEILKGHSSVLYGAGSPGGTVNYVTKKPQANPAHNLSYETGSYEFNRGVLDSTGALTDDKSLLYRVIAAGQLANDFRANITHDRASIAPSLTWHYAPEGVLNVGLEYSYQNQPYRFDNVFTQNKVVYDRSYVDPRTHSDRHYWRLSTSVEQQIVKNWSLQFASHYFHVERHDLLFGFDTFITPTRLNGYYRDIHDHYDQYSVRGELHGKFELLGSHQLVAGVERNASDDRLNSDRRIGGYSLDVYNPVFNYPIPKTTRLDTDLRQTEYGFYMNDTLDVSRFFHATGGVRYGLFQGRSRRNDKLVPAFDEKAITFNAGLSFTPVDNIAAYFGYSQSFQPNTGTDRQSHFFPAKRGELYEFGVKSSWLNQRLLLSSAIYQLSQTNLLSQDPMDADYFIANGTVRGRGVELDVTGQVLDNLQIVANYSYTDTKFIQHADYQGNGFRSTPPHSATLWAYYTLPIDGLKVGGGVVFADKRWGDDANRFVIPSYVRADLTAHYAIAPFDFRFKVENLLDKRYVSSSIYDDTVIQGNRRTVLFLASTSF